MIKKCFKWARILHKHSTNLVYRIENEQKSVWEFLHSLQAFLSRKRGKNGTFYAIYSKWRFRIIPPRRPGFFGQFSTDLAEFFFGCSYDIGLCAVSYLNAWKFENFNLC